MGHFFGDTLYLLYIYLSRKVSYDGKHIEQSFIHYSLVTTGFIKIQTDKTIANVAAETTKSKES